MKSVSSVDLHSLEHVTSLKMTPVSIYEGDPERDKAMGKPPLFTYHVIIEDAQPGVLIDQINVNYRIIKGDL